MKPWIGFDLDGTLAAYDGWKGVEHIGSPFPRMVEVAKRHLRAGDDVRIFTARLSTPGKLHREIVEPIQRWCLAHLGAVLPITNVKDMGMRLLYDDRAVRVEDGLMVGFCNCIHPEPFGGRFGEAICAKCTTKIAGS
jgi:hypothetical protein